MGCQSSSTNTVPNAHSLSDHVMPEMSDHTKQMIRESWLAFVEKNTSDPQKQYGPLIFFRLFQVSPDARELFHFIDKVDLLSLIENPQLIWHCNRILEALDDVVCSLDNLPAVAHAMSNLGRRHVTYGAKPDHLHALAAAILFSFEAALEEQFTEELKTIWTDVLQLLASHFISGMTNK